MHVLGHLSVEEFLRDYWQKKPVLIRNAWPGFEPLLPADELAGLSLEQEIESRLIIEDGIPGDNDSGPWQLKRGPFSEEDFRSLPENKWTLLIQGVDQWIPEAADLLEHFRFIPSWRIDDLMISYAVDGGNVGPHYDQYDVFLLQAEGQREWSIGQMCSEHSPFVKGPQIRVLEEFNESDSWVLNPSDMLYLPPQLAHHGVAKGECMTYSIGFRAPSQVELAQATLDEILVSASEDIRYQDPDLSLQKHSGEIDSSAAERLRNTLKAALTDDTACQRILGKLMTEAKYPEHHPETIDELSWTDAEQELNSCSQLRKSEFSRFAFSHNGNVIEFFYQGQYLTLGTQELPLIEQLCGGNALDVGAILELSSSSDARNLLTTLFRQQLIYTEE
ncbi:cupin domain-containing protein [Bacterioplanoides sp.]|uniref:cupin domain-containing protein n=1 Tax=Bacterioplanoides sp. TaxID=2066072 RepID=UPI003B595670